MTSISMMRKGRKLIELYKYFLIVNDKVVGTMNRKRKLSEKDKENILNRNYKIYGNNIWISG